MINFIKNAFNIYPNKTIEEIIVILPEETKEHILNSIEYEKYSNYCCEKENKGFNLIIGYYYVPKSPNDNTQCRLIRHLSECRTCGHVDDGEDSDNETRFRIITNNK